MKMQTKKPGKIKSAILNWLGVPGTLTDPEWWAAFGAHSDAGQNVTPDSALKLSAVWACTRLIAETISTLPLSMYERTPGGKRLADHPLQMVIHDMPNTDSTASVFWEAMVAAMLLRGNARAEKLMSGSRVVGLTFLDPCRLVPSRRADGTREWRYTEKDGKQRVISKDRIWRVPGFSLDGEDGVSVIRYGANVFGSAQAASSAADGTFDRGLMPTTYFKFPAFLKPEQRAEFRENLTKISGAINAGKPALLEGGMDTGTIGINPVDAQLLESRSFSVEEICRWFRVPPFMVGHSEKCLPAGEKVFTEHGPVNIEDVKVGQRVWSWNGSGLELQSVHHSEQTGVKPVVTIKTRSRTIRATANHRVLVRRKFPAPRPGVGGYRCVEWRDEWVEAGNVTPEDYLIGMHGAKSTGVDVAPNGRSITEQFMEFCGIYLAEGSMTDGHVSIARHKDAPYMDAYRDGMLKSFDRCSRGGTLTRDERKRERITLRELDRDTRFSSVHAVAELREIGLAGNAHTKRVPPWVFAASRPMQLAFLRGYLDGDGSVNSRGWIAWSSCNYELLEDVRHLCFLVGIPCGEVCRYETTGDVDIGGRTAKRGVMYQAWCYSARHNAQIGSHTPLYLQRWERNSGSSRVSPYDKGFKGRGPAGSRPGESWRANDAALLKVHSVDHGDIAVPVYDLGVTGTQSFVAGGVVVHNSTSWGTGIEQQMIGFLTFTLAPWLRRIEQAISKDLLTPSERRRYYPKFSVEGLLRADSAGRAAFYASMVNNGVLTRDEVRELEDRQAMGGNAGVLTVQSAMTTLDSIGSTSDAGATRAAMRAFLGFDAEPKKD